MFTNLPQPVEAELVDPSVAGVFREIAPRYLVREIFATKRDEAMPIEQLSCVSCFIF